MKRPSAALVPASPQAEMHYLGEGVHKRIAKAVDKQNGTVYRYVGPPGKERVVSAHEECGDTLEYEGPRGAEALRRRYAVADGELRHYDGERGHERVVSAYLWWTGATRHYEGAKGFERVVTETSACGVMRVFDADSTFGDERLTVVHLPDGGETQRYEGPRGHERKVSVVRPSDGWTWQYFKGPKGRERKVRTVFHKGGANERTQHFGGAPGREYLRREECANGDRLAYKHGLLKFWYFGSGGFARYDAWHDSRGEMYAALSSKSLPNGVLELYDGPPGQERLCRRFNENDGSTQSTTRVRGGVSS